MFLNSLVLNLFVQKGNSYVFFLEVFRIHSFFNILNYRDSSYDNICGLAALSKAGKLTHFERVAKNVN